MCVFLQNQAQKDFEKYAVIKGVSGLVGHPFLIEPSKYPASIALSNKQLLGYEQVAKRIANIHFDQSQADSVVTVQSQHPKCCAFRRCGVSARQNFKSELKNTSVLR